MIDIDAERAAVIAESKEWLRTPYVPNARVKGEHGGADCLTFLADTYANAGVIERLSIPSYSPEWHLHQTAELYLLGKDDTPGILHFCEEFFLPNAAALPLAGEHVERSETEGGGCIAHTPSSVLRTDVSPTAWGTAARTRMPLPADIVIFNFGHTFSHAAIVVDWPIVIHAWVRQGVALEDAERYTPLKKIFEIIEKRGHLRSRRFFAPKRWCGV